MNSKANGTFKLIQVQIYLRHGARTPFNLVSSPRVKEALWTSDLLQILPDKAYPFQLRDESTRKSIDMEWYQQNIEIKPILPGGTRLGELIQIGQEQAFEFGRRIKEKYIDELQFISDALDPKETYLRSTWLQRTITTLRCVVAGMYLNDVKRSNKPADIFVVPLVDDALVINEISCAKKKKLWKEGLEYCETIASRKTLQDRIKQCLGVEKLECSVDFWPFECDCPIYYVQDDYMSRHVAGFALPPGMLELLPEMSNPSTIEYLCEILGEPSNWAENLPAAMGGVNRNILASFRNRESLPKFQLYACHDSTIAAILLSLDLFDFNWPSFLSTVALELYECAGAEPMCSKDSFTYSHLWVRILYNQSPLKLVSLYRDAADKQFAPDETFAPLDSLIDRWNH